jgi:hypothetical protein
MRQVRLSNLSAVFAVLRLLASVFASPTRAQVIYEDKVVDGLPGPEALYDADQGEPQALLPEPREVCSPAWALPRGVQFGRQGH